MKILHISDLHFPISIPIWKLRGKMISGYLNYSFRRRSKYPVEAIKALIQKIKSLSYDLLIISGDITNISHPLEFAECKKILNFILDERAFLVPGNHDRYVRSAIEPEDLYLNTFSKNLGVQLETTNKYVKILELKNYYVIGWDSNHPSMIGDASGFLEESVVQVTLDFLKDKTMPYFLVCHHPIWNPPNKQENGLHKLRNREFVFKRLLEKPPLAYFHGHLHTNWVKKKEKDFPFYIFNSASSTRIDDASHNSGFHYIQITEQEWKIQRFHYVLQAKEYLETDVIFY
ncbi:MAG: metallophosphoesterase [Leptospiraceae bacterium]|nr:metallophosphoesterase [Leptospiraceae bacterium]